MTAHDEVVRDTYRLVRCGSCDLVFSDRLTVPEALYDEAYDHHAFYQEYIRQAREAQQHLHIAWAWRHFFRQAARKGRLLDIGSATGAFLIAAKARGWTPQGIDISPEAARIARETVGVDVAVGTLDVCAFPADSFDAVTGWEVLEHLPDPKPFVAEICRVLKPGGIVALSTPNWRSPWERATTHDNRRPPYHLTFWSQKPVTRLLQECGFTDVETREKPIAWSEEVGRLKWLYLPVAIIRSACFGHRGNRLAVFGRKLGA
jgi:2-polyprenyl-3-methyl-5-hydroxy-6-metoxy-1,4-benzoquinol methylase